jgi:hypothetical protein
LVQEKIVLFGQTKRQLVPRKNTSSEDFVRRLELAGD